MSNVNKELNISGKDVSFTIHKSTVQTHPVSGEPHICHEATLIRELDINGIKFPLKYVTASMEYSHNNTTNYLIQVYGDNDLIEYLRWHATYDAIHGDEECLLNIIKDMHGSEIVPDIQAMWPIHQKLKLIKPPVFKRYAPEHSDSIHDYNITRVKGEDLATLNEPLEFQLPFTGFYEGCFDEHVDNVIEHDTECAYELTYDEVFEALNLPAMRKLYVSDHARAMASALNDLVTGLNITFSAITFTSPKEYNFETDRVFVEVKRSQAKALWGFVNDDVDIKAILKALVKDVYSDGEGYFHTHDSPSPYLEKWGDYVNFKPSQWMLIIQAILDYEDLSVNELEQTIELQVMNLSDTIPEGVK